MAAWSRTENTTIWCGRAGATPSSIGFRRGWSMSSETIATGPKRKSKLIRLPFQQSCRRRQHELEFLPAALEIIETPASAAGRVMMGVIVVSIDATFLHFYLYSAAHNQR